MRCVDDLRTGVQLPSPPPNLFLLVFLWIGGTCRRQWEAVSPVDAGYADSTLKKACLYCGLALFNLVALPCFPVVDRRLCHSLRGCPKPFGLSLPEILQYD